MISIRVRLIVALIATLSVAQVVNAADPLHVGTMTVQRHGDHGTPIVLIPGLASGGWVWDDVVERLKNDHVLYVVTLAGFDGTAPAKGKLMELANDSLLELIRTQHVEKPVLIGHSLGGTLSIQFAETHSDLLAGVIAIDGLPVFPGTESFPAAQRAAMGEGMRTRMAGLTPAAFKAQQLLFMNMAGVLSESRANELAERTARSDPAATAQYMSEDIALDLRPELASIKVPLLEICPYNAADVAKTRPQTEKEQVEYYRTLLQGTPSLEVVSISPSRHFVMFDQPEKLSAELNRFLKALSGRTVK